MTLRNITWGRLGPVLVHALPESVVHVQNLALNLSMIQPSTGATVHVEGGVRVDASQVRGAKEGKIFGTAENTAIRQTRLVNGTGLLWLPYATGSNWTSVKEPWKIVVEYGNDRHEETLAPTSILREIKIKPAHRSSAVDATMLMVALSASVLLWARINEG